jgi:succinate dehydrogenase/fumarate reductase-like Fe-S protein
MRATLVRGPDRDGNSYRQTYELPDLAGLSVSNVLQYVSRHLDGSVAYYLSCRRGLCAACVVRVDGRNQKACVILAYDGIVIEPANTRLIIKDSVIHLGMPRKYEFDPRNSAFRAAASDVDDPPDGRP